MERLLCGLTLLLTAGSILAGGNIYQGQGATWNKKLIREIAKVTAKQPRTY